MAVDLDLVRPALAAHAITAPTVDGEAWVASTFTYEQLGKMPASRRHLAVSVGVSQARPTGGRVGSGSPSLVTSTVKVAFLFKVTPAAGIASEDAAVVAERVLLRHMNAPADFADGVRLTWDPSGTLREEINAGEWRRHILTFNALYYSVL